MVMIFLMLFTVFPFIHESGWVHHNISVGNVYLFEGRGMLSDLEYAKRKNDASQHDVRVRGSDFLGIICELRN